MQRVQILEVPRRYAIFFNQKLDGQSRSSSDGISISQEGHPVARGTWGSNPITAMVALGLGAVVGLTVDPASQT